MQRRWDIGRTQATTAALWGLTGLVFALVIYPLATVLIRLFVQHGSFTIDPFRQALAQQGLATTCLNTLIIVGLGGAAALVIAAILAWIAERTDATFGRIAGLVPVIPLFVPPLAGAIGWVFLLAPGVGFINVGLRDVFGLSGSTGPFNIFTMGGMAFVTALYLVPYAYLLLAAALRDLDPDLEAASRISGAGILRTLVRVTLPSIRSAFGAAIVIIVMMGLALLSVGIVIGTPARIEVISVRIYNVMVYETPPNFAEGMVLSILILGAIGIALAFQVLLSRGHRFHLAGTRAKAASRVRLGRWKWVARGLTACYMLFAVALPICALALVSLEHFWSRTIPWRLLGLFNYRKILSEAPIQAALEHSVELAAGAAVVGTVVAFALSWQQTRRRSGPGGITTAVVSLPAGIPRLVFGVAFLVAFDSRPLNLYGTPWLLLIAYITVLLPQAYQAAATGVRQVGRDLIESSYICGASEMRTVRRIALPLSLPYLVAGALVVYVLAASELNASIMLITPTYNTVGPTLFGIWNAGLFPSVAALCFIISAGSATVLLVSQVFLRAARKEG